MIQLAALLTTLTLPAVCGPAAELRGVFEKGRDHFERKLGADSQGDRWSLWAADGRWSLMVEMDDGNACIVAAHKAGDKV